MSINKPRKKTAQKNCTGHLTTAKNPYTFNHTSQTHPLDSRCQLKQNARRASDKARRAMTGKRPADEDYTKSPALHVKSDMRVAELIPAKPAAAALDGGTPRAARRARARRLDRAAAIHSAALLVAACVLAAAARRANSPPRRPVAARAVVTPLFPLSPLARPAPATAVRAPVARPLQTAPEGNHMTSTKMSPPSYTRAPREWREAGRRLDARRADNAARAAAARADELPRILPRQTAPRPDPSP